MNAIINEMFEFTIFNIREQIPLLLFTGNMCNPKDLDVIVKIIQWRGTRRVSKSQYPETRDLIM